MGIIVRQSIFTTIISYVGVALGYVNIVLLFPEILQPEEFGLTRILISAVAIASQVALLGISNTIIKFFPHFKNEEEGHRGILPLSLIYSIGGLLVVSLLLVLFKPLIVDYYQEKSELFVNYYYLLFPLLLFELLYNVLNAYTRALYRSVAHVLLKTVVLRILVLVLLLVYQNGLLSFDAFITLFVLLNGFIVFLLFGYIASIRQLFLMPKVQFLKKKLLGNMLNYSLFTLMSTVTAILIANVDVIMLGAMMGLDDVAFYAVAFYIVAVIDIPKQSINNIAKSIISTAWKENDLKTIQQVYKKTSINQMIIGGLLFIGIWANADNIFQILPEKYAVAKYVLLLVGLGRLADTSFGINGGIITTSKYYRFDTVAYGALAVLVVVTNLIFIPIYGLNGAAFATSVSLVVFNLTKYIFLKIKFNLSPFERQSIYGFAVIAAVYVLGVYLPAMDNYLLDILVRSAVITIVYGLLVYFLKLSDDVNNIINRFLGIGS